MKKYFCEAIGTCVLVLFGCGTACLTKGDIVITALAFGLSIIAMAYVIGNISGCHVNPAVSLAMFINKKITLKEFLFYVLSQIIGAFIGTALLFAILIQSGAVTSLGRQIAEAEAGGEENQSAQYSDFQYTLKGITDDAYGVGLGANGYGERSSIKINMWAALLVEVILTFVFIYTILGVTSDASKSSVAGIVIGLTLTFVHILGITITGTSVNPARSLAPATVMAIIGKYEAIKQVWVFIVAPFVGSALAAFAFKLLNKEKEVKEAK